MIMSKIAEMKCDTLLFEDDIKAEERSRLSCVDLPQSSLPDGQSADLLRSQETNGDISPIRRYGYALFVCVGNCFKQLNRGKYFVYSCNIPFFKVIK